MLNEKIVRQGLSEFTPVKLVGYEDVEAGSPLSFNLWESTNHMAEVAKMLSVELGEEFEVQTTGQGCFSAMINEQDICVPECEGYYPEYNKSIILRNLLRGKYTIKRKHWKPSEGDIYWHISSNGNADYYCWTGDVQDFLTYKLGNCYRTREEAEANRDKWVKFYASDEVLEV